MTLHIVHEKYDSIWHPHSVHVHELIVLFPDFGELLQEVDAIWDVHWGRPKSMCKVNNVEGSCDDVEELHRAVRTIRLMKGWRRLFLGIGVLNANYTSLEGD